MKYYKPNKIKLFGYMSYYNMFYNKCIFPIKKLLLKSGYSKINPFSNETLRNYGIERIKF